MEERETHGKYKDLEDFITRTASRGVNKRAIENFIKAGAFDSFGATRKQMMMVYIQIMDGVNQERKDAMDGQISLFDFAGAEAKETYKVQMPNVGEYEIEQKLEFEKEVLGIYASGHPLQSQEKKWRKHITNMAIDFAEVEEGEEPAIPDKSKVTIGGIVAAVTKKFTKNGQQMAFLTLEDLVGTVEVIVFPRQFERNRALMEDGKKLFVTGEAQFEENAAGRVIANSITEFSMMPSELWIAFPDKETYVNQEQELISTLMSSRGNDKVCIALAKEQGHFNENKSVDAAIVQKLLPKLHGSRKKLVPVLTTLWDMCETGIGLELAEGVPEQTKYPLTADKLLRMYRGALDNGFTSFAEA